MVVYVVVEYKQTRTFGLVVYLAAFYLSIIVGIVQYMYILNIMYFSVLYLYTLTWNECSFDFQYLFFMV